MLLLKMFCFWMKQTPTAEFEIIASRLLSHCHWSKPQSNEAVKLHRSKVYLSLFWLPNFQAFRSNRSLFTLFQYA